MILVGGEGSRLRRVVNDRPKPMADVAGRPFVEWLVIALGARGVRRVVFCTGYMSEVIEAHFRDGERWGMEILYCRDPYPLGTAGAVRHALGLVCSNPLLVINGDSYCRADLSRLAEVHVARGALASLWLVTVADCRRYGLVEIGEDGAVLGFCEKPLEKRAGLINAGVYLFERRLVESIPEGRPVSMESNLLPSLVGHGLYAVVGGGPFIDIGTPEAYAKAQKFLSRIGG